MKKNITPATKLTVKLYFKKLTAASNICWQSNINTVCSLLTRGISPSFSYDSGIGLRRSCTKFSAAQIKGKTPRVATKTMTPVCERGASPSGVEDPTMREYRSIVIIIRLLIIFNFSRPTTQIPNNLKEPQPQSFICFRASIITILMEGKKNESDSDSDDFDFEEWRKNKIRTQEITVEVEKKRTASDLDGKKTIKYREDPVMNSMYEKILRESDKFEEILTLPIEQRKDLYQYNPHIICGKLTNIRKSNAIQKESFGLQEEGECQAMDLTSEVIVVLIGKIGYTPIQGINANLYIPRDCYEYISNKSPEAKAPERLVRTSENKYVIWIKREHRKDGSMSILDYPYLILDPQNLLYPSYLCSWIDCKRLISLNNYVQGEKDVNEAIVYGSTCHRLLQWLAENVITLQQYRSNKKATLERLYNSMLYDMFLINRTYEQFTQTCSFRLDNLVRFYERHIIKGEELEVERYKRTYLKIEKIVSSEYMFRSNFFGLKGKVDLLLAGQLIDKKNNKSEQVYIPMQLKTGKRVSDSHKRQTDIYNILVRQKYKRSVVGLLYYSDSDIKFFRIEEPLLSFEILIVHRNQIAQNLVKLYQKGDIVLPNFAVAFQQCNFCHSSGLCELSYNEIQELSNDANMEQVPSKFHKSIEPTSKKYSRKEIEYISRWFKMIHLEQLQCKKLNTDYWKMGISNFVLPHPELINIRVQESKVRLDLSHHCKTAEQLTIFQDFYKISMKVRIVINMLNLIEGCKIVSTSIDNNTKQFKMIIQMNSQEIEYSPTKLSFFIDQESHADVDIETFQSSFFGVMRNTALNLIENENYLKNILINDKSAKEVIEISEDEQETVLKQDIAITSEELEGFNDDQKKAFKKSVLQNRFCLIQGMPGTGKTELIIRLIEKFSKMKKTVLVTTFTNRSLDNILERLVDSERVPKDKIIREGAQYSCSKSLKEYTSHGVKFTNLQEYKKFYSQKTIWFVTLSSLFIHHLPKKFDVVILDEASQCLEPTCIEGLLRSQKFILIGDYKQLQPVIKSRQAYRKGMCLSLFQRLCKLYPQNTVSLKKQYRMNHKIMALSNQLVYDGELQLASESIKSKTVKLPNQWQKRVPTSFVNVISPSNSIVFINYDPIIDSITKKYKEKEPMIRKIIEAELPAFIFRTFAELKIPLSSIAIIAALNSSVNKIIDLLKQSKTLNDNHGTVLTIDKSQGIDKQVIILLIERGNEELMENPRRLNVALTRAKSKLIIIGSEEHLSKMKVWDGTLGRMLKEYQIELSKAMIEDMISFLGSF